MTRIIVDSICDLPQKYLQQYQIEILPLRVNLNGRDYRDRVDITTDEVYEQMRAGVVPKTSQASPEDILTCFTQYAQNGEDFIYLAFSAVLSGTCQTAQMLIKGLEIHYPQVRMTAVDTKAAALTQGMMALQLCRMIEKGANYNELLQQLDFMIAHAEHILSIADMDWLVKGGRINKLAGKTGSVLNIHPVIEVNDGYLKVIGAVRGNKKMLTTLVDMTMTRIQNFPEQTIGICHAGDYERALETAELLKARLGHDRILIEQIGCVLGVHLGIGGIGILFFNEKPPFYEH